MNPTEYHKLQSNCQPHPFWKKDWNSYYSLKFADTFLPKANGFASKGLRIYDGAEILLNTTNFQRRFLQLTPDVELINLTLFSYPIGVEAVLKKSAVVPTKSELCIFFEIDIDNKISIYLKSGDNFKKLLKSLAKTKKNANIYSLINEKFSTSLDSFQSFFKYEYSHYRTLAYVGKLLGFDFTEQHNKSVLKVHILSVNAYTSEPSDNNRRAVKEKQTKYIKIDFEILNQPAINYSLHVSDKEGDTIFNEVYLADVNISVREKPKLTKSIEESSYPPGKYQIIWDCTNNGILDKKNTKQLLIIKIQAIGLANQVAFSRVEINLKILIDKIKSNNFIIVLDEKNNQQKIFGNEIIERQKKFVTQMPEETYTKLPEKEKLILNLPIILTKLNFLYGALCQIHWIEGSKKTLKFPYEFFTSEKRVENIDYKNLKNYFKEIRYLSVDNLGYLPSNPDGANLFLYNDDLSTVKTSLNKFHDDLKQRTGNGPIGGEEKFIDEITQWEDIKNNDKKKEEFINPNFFQSFSEGSALGDIDDLGIAVGKYSQRCYYRGLLSKNINTGKWVLSINEVICRFSDDFSFNDNLIDIGPIEYSQRLGCWVNDIENVSLPSRSKVRKDLKPTVCIQNIDYQKLKKSLSKIAPNSCNDFFILSNFKSFTDDFIQKDIVIF